MNCVQLELLKVCYINEFDIDFNAAVCHLYLKNVSFTYLLKLSLCHEGII